MSLRHGSPSPACGGQAYQLEVRVAGGKCRLGSLAANLRCGRSRAMLLYALKRLGLVAIVAVAIVLISA